MGCGSSKVDNAPTDAEKPEKKKETRTAETGGPDPEPTPATGGPDPESGKSEGGDKADSGAEKDWLTAAKELIAQIDKQVGVVRGLEKGTALSSDDRAAAKVAGDKLEAHRDEVKPKSEAALSSDEAKSELDALVADVAKITEEIAALERKAASASEKTEAAPAKVKSEPEPQPEVDSIDEDGLARAAFDPQTEKGVAAMKELAAQKHAEHLKDLADKGRAATKIQATFRGHKARKEIGKAKSEEPKPDEGKKGDDDFEEEVDLAGAEETGAKNKKPKVLTAQEKRDQELEELKAVRPWEQMKEQLVSRTKTFDNGDEYDGQFNGDGQQHGHGVYKFSNGDIYTGDFVDGKFHGWGKFEYESGDVYEGQFADDVYEGEGRFTDGSAGDSYDGSFKAGKRHGNGTYTYKNGDVFTGQFDMGSKVGQGKFSNAAGTTTYDGDYVDNQRHGTGIFVMDGNRYHGDFVDGKMNGKGELQYKNGNVWEGDIHDGKPYGSGSFTLPEGSVYEGVMKEDGSFKPGVMLMHNGDVYTGEFYGRKPHGRGVFVYKDGSQYDGEIWDGKRHGKGKQSNADGELVSDGNWHNDAYKMTAAEKKAAAAEKKKAAAAAKKEAAARKAQEAKEAKEAKERANPESDKYEPKTGFGGDDGKKEEVADVDAEQDNFAGTQYLWANVPDVWKDHKGEDKDLFSREKLEEVFPGDKSKAKARSSLWSDLDNNGNNYVSLAEFDGWFNKVTLAVEKPKGEGSDKSELYRYGRSCLIRAFNLANGVAKVNPNASGINASGDDYITKPEFRLLLVALQASLAIYRAFDQADTSDDKRISRAEWAAQLGTLNGEIKSWGYEGDELTAEDFDKVDADGGGMILLDEAVHFFLGFFTQDKHLLAENEEEGA